MDEKYGEFVGVDNLHIAKVLNDNTDVYSAEAPRFLAPAADVAGEPEVNKKTTYYDNVAANVYTTEGNTIIKTTVSGIPAKLAAELTGKSFDATSGRVYDSGQANPPYYALGFRYKLGSNDYRYYWYLKGTFSLGAEEAASKSDDVDVKTYSLEYTAVVTSKKWTVDGKLQPLKRVVADTTEDAFDPDGWFDAVQTPDTSGTPDALSIESTVPADEATGVAVDTALTLTCNNAISSYSITLMDVALTTPVTVTSSLDTTKKIITITPSSNLSNNKQYAVVVGNITDIYGQKVENQVIDFTTVA